MRQNKTLSLAILAVLMAIIYITIIITFIISFCEKSKIKHYNLIKNIMKYLLPTISLSFFGQIFESLLLIFMCEENSNPEKYYSFECPDKSLKYLFYVLCSFAIFF